MSGSRAAKRLIAQRRYYRQSLTGTPEKKIRALLQLAKQRAKRDGADFSVTLADIEITTHCPMLGLAFAWDNSIRQDNSPSIDRIENHLGYVPGNVWLVSNRANSIKRDATAEELRMMVSALEKKRGRL